MMEVFLRNLHYFMKHTRACQERCAITLLYWNRLFSRWHRVCYKLTNYEPIRVFNDIPGRWRKQNIWKIIFLNSIMIRCFSKHFVIIPLLCSKFSLHMVKGLKKLTGGQGRQSPGEGQGGKPPWSSVYWGFSCFSLTSIIFCSQLHHFLIIIIQFNIVLLIIIIQYCFALGLLFTFAYILLGRKDCNKEKNF